MGALDREVIGQMVSRSTRAMGKDAPYRDGPESALDELSSPHHEATLVENRCFSLARSSSTTSS